MGVGVGVGSRHFSDECGGPFPPATQHIRIRSLENLKEMIVRHFN